MTSPRRTTASTHATSARRPSTALSALENRLAGDTATARPPAVSPAAWQQAVGGVAAGLSKAGTQASAEITSQASANARSTYLLLIVAGGLGLLAVAVSILVSVRVGRSMVRELRELRHSALDLANERLPSVVNRLAEGQDVDVAAEAPELPAEPDEIGQVGQAFAAVQQTAVEAAVGQARLRAGDQRHLPQPGPAQPVAAAPSAHPAGCDGAPGQRARGARRPVPHRPPDHPDAAARGEPDHPVRRRPGPGLAPTRCRSSTCSAPPWPRSRTTPGSRSPRPPGRPSPAQPWPTSST